MKIQKYGLRSSAPRPAENAAKSRKKLEEELASANEELTAVNEELRTANDELRAEIERRREAETAMREANENLTRFNRAAADRELRMVELKKEVNGLRARLGEPAPDKTDFDNSIVFEKGAG